MAPAVAPANLRPLVSKVQKHKVKELYRECKGLSCFFALMVVGVEKVKQSDMIGLAIHSQTITIIMSAVLLLRQPEQQDKYEAVLGEAGLSPISVAVLETRLTNDPRLRTIIQSGPTREGLNGVIITSKRSCEAWPSQ